MLLEPDTAGFLSASTSRAIAQRSDRTKKAQTRLRLSRMLRKHVYGEQSTRVLMVLHGGSNVRSRGLFLDIACTPALPILTSENLRAVELGARCAYSLLWELTGFPKAGAVCWVTT